MTVSRPMRRIALAPLLVLIICVAVASVVAQQNSNTLRMDQVMTPDELRATGVATLTPAQRVALDRWLNKYTLTLARVLKGTSPAGTRADCSPAVESNISGEFAGWSGETIFKLDNGQIWEQAEYDYMYSYQYHPDVTIYATTSGCRMKVEDEEDTLLVHRIK